MIQRKPRWSPLEKALLATARKLDKERKGVAAESVGHGAVLAMLRRLVFRNLDAGWKSGQKNGCPLLDQGLDGKAGVDPRRAVDLAEVPAEATDPGQVYQQLQDVQIARKGKGDLGLSRGRARRRRSGLFFTPDWMAERLASMALDPLPVGQWSDDPAGTLRILDPACGSGRLLLAAARFLGSKLSDGPVERTDRIRTWIREGIRGVDIDPVAIAIARTAFWLEADPRRDRVEGIEEAFVVGDAIGGPLAGGRRAKGALDWEKSFPEEVGEGKGFDVVVANPPFEVLKGFARRQGLRQYTERIRKSGYQHALHGNLNTYRLFLERSLQVLRDGGRLAFVLPFGFLMDRTAAPLRAHMLRSGWIRRVEMYPESSRVFEEVGQSVVLLEAAKEPCAAPAVLVSDGSGQEPACRVSVDDLVSLDEQQVPIPMLTPSSFGLAAKMRHENTSCFGAVANGRVGEVDQTVFRKFMRSSKSDALLLRGTHLSPYQANLETDESEERWLDRKGFVQARGKGPWADDIQSVRVVQTGIVNLEAGRRLVAARVPDGVYLGNSVNYWVPKDTSGWDPDLMRGYLLGLLNSTPMEWRFRLTSSNNNINLYEIRSLPLPSLTGHLPSDRVPSFLEQSAALIRASRSSVLGTVRQITAGWGAPERDDRSVGMLIGKVALLREDVQETRRAAWMDAVIDHLVNWHLGMDEPDLGRMLEDVPARAWEED